MLIKKWEELPDEMKNESVRIYYDILQKKKLQLFFKRLFDVIIAVIMVIILLLVIFITAIIIKIDSSGPVMFWQIRIIQYGKRFRIYKFRTMVPNAEAFGTQVTTQDDMRVTKVGRILRKYRIDEIPQLFNVILGGDMTFVGTRPEVAKYVEQYTDEMMATLLLPAGITSEASINYKDEEHLLSKITVKEAKREKVLVPAGVGAAGDIVEYEEEILPNTENTDITYIHEILPEKMRYNLESIENFSLINDIKTMMRTAAAVVGK